MKLNIFGKKGTSKDGRAFPIYLSTLTKKDGTEIKVSVKFRQDAKQPELADCPCVIEVDKKNANLTIKEIKDAETGELLYDETTGEVKTSKTLWVAAWKMVGPYVDHSLDDFEG